MWAVLLLLSLADLAEHTKFCQNIDKRSLILGQILSGTISILGALYFKIICWHCQILSCAHCSKIKMKEKKLSQSQFHFPGLLGTSLMSKQETKKKFIIGHQR